MSKSLPTATLLAIVVIAFTILPVMAAPTDPCPSGTGPGGITAGDYPPTELTQDQRQWLFEVFGHSGIASVGYGGERCGEEPEPPPPEPIDEPQAQLEPQLQSCPSGIGPGGITAGDYPPTELTQEQRQWLFEVFGHSGIASVGYGGERCTGGGGSPPPPPLPPCPAGIGPGDITAGDYPPTSLTQEQRQWLWERFGHTGIAPVGYGGKRCEGQTSSTPPDDSPSPTCNDSAFVADVTVPDGTNFSAGTSFTKTWRIRNSGSCTWGQDYTFVFVSGDQMGGPNAVGLSRSVAPGHTIDISVNLVSPGSSGSYRGYWRLRTSAGELFGQHPFVDIVVVAAPADNPPSNLEPELAPLSTAELVPAHPLQQGSCDADLARTYFLFSQADFIVLFRTHVRVERDEDLTFIRNNEVVEFGRPGKGVDFRRYDEPGEDPTGRTWWVSIGIDGFLERWQMRYRSPTGSCR